MIRSICFSFLVTLMISPILTQASTEEVSQVLLTEKYLIAKGWGPLSSDHVAVEKQEALERLQKRCMDLGGSLGAHYVVLGSNGKPLTFFNMYLREALQAPCVKK